MLAYLQLLAGRASPNLLLGIKLPPFTYHGESAPAFSPAKPWNAICESDNRTAGADQFEAVIEALRVVAKAPSPSAPHPISFLTSTNTLGQGEQPPYLYLGEIVRAVIHLEDARSDADEIGLSTTGLVFAAEETPVPRDLASSGRPRPPAQDQLTALPSAKSDSGSLPGGEGSVEGGWGGLAGGTLHPLAVGNVARLAQMLRRPNSRPPLEGDSETEHGEEEVVRKLAGIAIVGVGGVSDAEGVERFRRAGADAVVSLARPVITHSSPCHADPCTLLHVRRARPRSGGKASPCLTRCPDLRLACDELVREKTVCTNGERTRGREGGPDRQERRAHTDARRGAFWVQPR